MIIFIWQISSFLFGIKQLLESIILDLNSPMLVKLGRNVNLSRLSCSENLVYGATGK